MDALISLIAAVGKDTRAIGRDDKLLWRIPGDLPRFKALTMGHAVVMGRKTYESIGKPLPGRTNIVVTRNQHYRPEGVVIVHNVPRAIAAARIVEEREIFILGGGEIYAATLPMADRLYLTLVDDPAEGDTYFPDYSGFSRKTKHELGMGDPPHVYVTLER